MRRRDGTLRAGPRIAVLVLAVIGCGLAAADPFTLAFFVAYAAVGVLLVVRRPGNVVSWLVLAIAFAFIGTTSPPDLDVAALSAGNASLHDTLFASTSAWSGSALFASFAALAVLFPTGNLPEGRWRRPAVALLAGGVAIVVLSAVSPTVDVSPDGVNTIQIPNPLAALPDLPLWSILSGPTAIGLIIGLLAIGVVSMLVRYRRATEISRLQLRWLLAAILFVLSAVLFGLISTVLVGDTIGGLAWIPAIVAYPTVPIAIAFAILRYRLYEIDRIVNRALVYGAITAILAGVFAAATALAQRIFIALTGQTSDAAVILTTLAIATLYTPLRKRIEGVVDRYFKYGQTRFGPYRDELERLLGLVDPGRAAKRLADEAVAGTGASGAAVISPDGVTLATSGSWPSDAAIDVPIGEGDAPLARILLGGRHDGRPHDQVRLDSLAAVGSLAVAALGAERPQLGQPQHVHLGSRRSSSGDGNVVSGSPTTIQ